MEESCHQLRRNAVASIDCLDIYDDRFAFQLAGSLMTNKSLKTLEIVIWDEKVTSLGAQALARAIQKSAIENLEITTAQMYHVGVNTAKSWNILWCICQSALRVVSELTVHHEFGDIEASMLGRALRCSKNRKLKKLVLGYAVTTQKGARALMKGVQKSSVTDFKVRFSSKEVYCILSLEGMPSISCLKISSYENFSDPFLGNFSPQLQTLSLGLERRDRLNDRDIKQLTTKMSENRNLRQLRLDAHTITDDGVKDLVGSWKKWPLLERLDLSSNQVGVAGLNRLVRASSLHPCFTVMNLWSNPSIGQEGLSSIAPELIDGLKSGQLQHLCLNQCELSDQDMDVFCRGLYNNSSVKTLHLARNRIGDEGVACLVKCLDNGLPLEELYLSSNPIGAVGVQSLVRATFAREWRLKRLEMIECNRISYQELAMIAKELATSRLSNLSIQVDGDSDSDSKGDEDEPSEKAKQEACTIASRALVHAVKANMHLLYLGLPLLNIPQSVKNEIQFFLDLETSGRQLLRLDDGLDPIGLWCHVFAKCDTNASVIFYLLGEQPALVPSSARHDGCGGKATLSSSSMRKTKLVPSSSTVGLPQRIRLD